MLAGCVYGVILGITLLRNVEVKSRAVHPQTALSYAVLLAVLVLIAWPRRAWQSSRTAGGCRSRRRDR